MDSEDRASTSRALLADLACLDTSSPALHRQLHAMRAAARRVVGEERVRDGARSYAAGTAPETGHGGITHGPVAEPWQLGVLADDTEVIALNAAGEIIDRGVFLDNRISWSGTPDPSTPDVSEEGPA